MVSIEEVKHRLREKLKKKYPKIEITEKGDNLFFEVGEIKGVFYPHKLLAEIQESHPADWEGLVDKRIKLHEIWTKKKMPKIIRLIPRLYHKKGFLGPEGKELTSKELEKGGLIILKEMEDAWIFLAADTEGAFITLPKEKILEQMTEKEFDRQMAKAKKKLEELGI